MSFIKDINFDNVDNVNNDSENNDSENNDSENNDSENNDSENDDNNQSDNVENNDSENNDNNQSDNVEKYILKFPIDINKNYDHYIKLFIKVPFKKIKKSKKIYQNNNIIIIGQPKFMELYFNKKEPLKNVIDFIKNKLDYQENDNIVLTINNNRIKYGKYNYIGYCGINKYDTINLLELN